MNMLPLVGGFNDGKYIEHNCRNIIKMAKPKEYSVSITHHEEVLNFDYEIYNLVSFNINEKSFNFYLIEGMCIEDAIEKLVYGYKQYKKKQMA